MKKSNRIVQAALFCFGLGLAAALTAQQAEGPSHLTLPWDEFKKLLRMDENEIVLPLDSFNKLVAQTGVKTPPPHVERQGLVVMTRAAFARLVDDMKIPADSDAVPPFDYIVTRAVYTGTMAKNGTRFVAQFRIHVLKRNAYLKIPLLHQGMALEDLTVDGDPALTVAEGGFHHIVLSKPGEHVANATFTVKSDLVQGPYRMDLSIQPTPITLLRLNIPLRDIDVEIPQAQALSVEPSAGGTAVSAVLSPTGGFSVAWRKKVPAQEKLPPKLYAEVNHLVSIEEEALRFNSDVVFNILHSEVDGVSLAVPEGWNVLGVSGEAVGAWQEKAAGGRRVVTVPFTYGRKGNVIVNVQSELPMSDKGKSNAFEGFRVLNVVRETGAIGVELNTGAEVKAIEAEGLTRVAVQKLPPMLYNKSSKPLIFAYKYAKHPFTLVLDVERHEKIAVPMASVVSANAVTLFTEDGKVVHRLIYRVRNSEKQFLEIRLPKGADVWSVFVGNEPVEASLGSDGKLLVPLIRSRYAGTRLEPFPVEIIYCLSEKSFRLFGWRGADLPPADVMTSQLVWSVYVPNDYAYLYFKSTLEKEEIIRGVNVLGRKGRVLSMPKPSAAPDVGLGAQRMERDAGKVYQGKAYKSEFRNVPMEEQQAVQQLEAEMRFGDRLDELSQNAPQSTGSAGGAGILPIQIEVPTTGQVYRFAKTIIKPEDGLTVRVLYARQGLVRSVRWVLFLLIVWIAYRFRQFLRRVFDGLARGWKRIQPGLEKTDAVIPLMLGSRAAFWILAFLSLVALFVSKWLFVLLFLLLLVVVVYQGIMHFRKRKLTRSRGRKK